ncbi:coenzyme F420 hydrogenase subunit beta [Halanaerobium saccharolyticum]|uniref:Coenzyme F420 hydrogenase subunit beta n=1 Tax=Halanaerobium saccharolyticum TaxID=43595 RepID=A0A4R6LKM7_9FIRM|nr:Coenzyme F420 hydrogenase/dehydrogenase, beta subunit C-terminal domain [Halanaerobium saccharolyticum]TDO84356.1 coenzyme F420 hydrogenase subunit beta [Halanaerobium saccharolyticum]
MKNVGDMDLDYLCTGCGGCEVICPTDAIKIKLKNDVYLPQVDDNKCIKCNKCLLGCPGLSLNSKKYSDMILKVEESTKEDFMLGKFISNYLAYSTDKKLRFEAATGGLATSILIYLFNENIINGAVVTKMNEQDKTKSKTFVAQSIEEIRSAKTSKYCSTHPLSTLKELKKTSKDKKFAFVGLPCHIHGLRKIQEQEKWVKDKIIFSIGILCTHSVDYSGTRLILDKMACGKENLIGIQYRGNGWPGSAAIEYKDKKISIPLENYWNPYFGPYFFTPYRCISCNDLTAELADVSLGDALLKDIEENDDQGTSIVISRNNFVEKIIKKMADKNLLSIEKISKNIIKESQQNILIRKKVTLAYRLSLFRFFSKAIPETEDKISFSNDMISQKTKGYLGAFLIWFNSYLSKTKIGYNIIKLLPVNFLKKYSYYVNRIAGRK